MKRRRDPQAQGDLFVVVIEDDTGRRRGSLTPEEFRRGVSCPRTAFLRDCVSDWNAYKERRGEGDRARIEMTLPVKKQRKR
jgi:hypothetical protein